MILKLDERKDDLQFILTENGFIVINLLFIGLP